MKLLAAVALGAALAVGAPAGANAAPKSPQGRGHQVDQNSEAYRDGYNRGRDDAQHRRSANSSSSRWHARFDRDAYAAGYNAGYSAGGSRYGDRGRDDRDRDRDRDRDGDRDRDRDRDNRSGQPGAYGQPGPYGQPAPYGQPQGGRYGTTGTAQQMGYQDGLNDGQKDRATGHSFRPTEGDNYKSASRGYSSAMGSKDAYKQAYRQSYAGAYQRGYYGR